MSSPRIPPDYAQRILIEVHLTAPSIRIASGIVFLEGGIDPAQIGTKDSPESQKASLGTTSIVEIDVLTSCQ
jgi:hypothetical protein